MRRQTARRLRHPVTRSRAILAALSLMAVISAWPITASRAGPVEPEGTVFAGGFVVDYIGVDEAAARQVLEAGSPIMDRMDRLLTLDRSLQYTSPPTVRILVAPASGISGPNRLVAPAADGGVLTLRRSGDGWVFSHDALAALMAQVYLRPRWAGVRPSIWSDGLAVLAAPASTLPLPGYRRPAADAAFREDLRTFARDLQLLGELKVRKTTDFFGAVRDTRFYRYQAAALVASVIEGGHPRALFTLAQLSDRIQQGHNTLQDVKPIADQLGLTGPGLDPDSVSSTYLAWLGGADTARLGNSVTVAVRHGQATVWALALAGIALATALVGMGASPPGRGVGGPDRFGLLARTLGLYAVAATAEYGVGVLPVTTPLKNLLELALIALAALAVRHEARRRTGSAAGAAGAPVAAGAIQTDSFPRAALMAFGLFAAIMAVRLAVYSEDHFIFGKATTILLVVLWVLRYERAKLTEVGLTFRRLGAQLAVGFIALLLYRVLELVTYTVTPYLLGSHPTGLRFVWWWPTPVWQILSFAYGNFAEELFFRGYVQAKLDRAARTKVALALAIVIQSLLFGLYHMNYDLFPYRPLHLLWYIIFAGTFGFIMALFYRATGSVVVSAVAHPLWNMRVLGVWLNDAGGYGWMLGGLVYHATLAGLALLIVPPVMKRVMAAFGEVSFRDPAPAFRAAPRRLAERLATASHDAARWPLERKLLAGLTGLSAVIILLLLTVIPVTGRVVLSATLMAFAGAFVVMGYTRSRYRGTLADLAREMEFTHVERPEQEVGDPLVGGLHWSYAPDIYALKIDGQYPYVIGRYRDFTVMVRRPRAVEFELNAPDTTRVAVYHKSLVKGLTVYSARRYPRTLHLTATGDEEFDRRFKVRCRDLTELRAILNDDIRRRLVGLDRVGVTGVTVNPQGLFFYEPGLVTKAADLREVLELLTAMAAAVAGLRAPAADRPTGAGPQ